MVRADNGIFEIIKGVKSGIGSRILSLPQNDGQLFLYSGSEVIKLNFLES